MDTPADHADEATQHSRSNGLLPLVLGEGVQCDDLHVIGVGWHVRVYRDFKTGILQVEHRRKESWFRGFDLLSDDFHYDPIRQTVLPEPQPVADPSANSAEAAR